MLVNGDKILVFHRRRFEEDHLRFFVGTVNEFENGVAGVAGHSWIQDVQRGAFHRKPDMRTQLVPVTTGEIVIYKLPKLVNLDDLSVEFGRAKEPLLTDGGEFRFDITDKIRTS
jgi:hypothetical protein